MCCNYVITRGWKGELSILMRRNRAEVQFVFVGKKYEKCLLIKRPVLRGGRGWLVVTCNMFQLSRKGLAEGSEGRQIPVREPLGVQAGKQIIAIFFTGPCYCRQLLNRGVAFLYVGSLKRAWNEHAANVMPVPLSICVFHLRHHLFVSVVFGEAILD
jgi:hypothetical protein